MAGIWEKVTKYSTGILLILLTGFFHSIVAAQDTPPPPLVGVMEVKPQTLTLTDNLPGRLESSKHAAVRARVTGIIEKRLFKEGSFVHQGDILFTVDARPFRAALQSAKGTLARAIAQKKLNESVVKRYRKLIASKAVSLQMLDQAEATLATAVADIEIAKAAVTRAQLDLDYATVSAPISGFIGQQEVTVGALVSASAATQMAQIRQIDPLYVNIQQSAAKILKLKAMMQGHKEKMDELSGMKVKIFLDDGTLYPHQGTLIFTDVAVNAATGEATVRALVPNPEQFLMPGLYVRVEIPLVTLEDVVLVPQQAINRTDKGDMVMVLEEDNSFSPRPVTIARSWKNNWVVTDGLKKGEKIIVDGMVKVHFFHAKKVTPVPWQKLQEQKRAANAPVNQKKTVATE